MVCERLQIVREEAQKTQTAVANILGITRQAYNHYETGKREPSLDTLSKLATLYDVSVDYLLGKTDIKKPPVEITDEEAKDEFVGFYGDIKKDLTEGDLEDIKKLMRLRAELNRSDKE